MSEYAWQDVAEGILRGSAELAPHTGSLFKTTHGGSEIVGACAMGAGRWTLRSMFNNPTRCHLTVGMPREWTEAETTLVELYRDQYGVHLAVDNDRHGRDHVLYNLKEMLNSDERQTADDVPASLAW